MDPAHTLTVSRLKALIVLSELEEERLHAILDDDAVDGKEREDALEELACVLQSHRAQLERLAGFESQQ
jgi:hypothetical protein